MHHVLKHLYRFQLIENILFGFDLCFLEIRTFHLKRTMFNLLILTNRKNNELQSNAIHKQGL